jgi:hypothetical protein
MASMTGSLLALALILVPAAAPQTAADLEREKPAIVQTALDYAEGYYGGEPARMARAVSPSLSKRGLMVRPGVPPFLVQMNADTLVDAANGAKVAPADRHITTDVLDVQQDIASARVFTAQFNDYLQLVKRNGAWQIVNVLWHAPPAAGQKTDGAADGVERAVRAYVAALYASDAPALLAVVHPQANLRTFAPPPQGRPRIIREQNPETLAAALAGGMVKVPGKADDAQVVVQGVDADIAAAKLTIGQTPTYLHLAMTDGRWRIVNALGYPPAPPATTTSR